MFVLIVRMWLFMAGLAALTTGEGETSTGDGKNTDAPAGDDTANPKPDGGDKTFTQADVDRVVQTRLAQEKEREAKRGEAEKKKHAEETLKKNNEWQALAEQRQTELDALKPHADRATVLVARMNEQIASEIKDWPAEVTALDPGSDNLEARLNWLDKARPLAAKLAVPPKPPSTQAGAGSGTGSTSAPKPATGDAPKPTYRFQQPGDVSW